MYNKSQDSVQGSEQIIVSQRGGCWCQFNILRVAQNFQGRGETGAPEIETEIKSLQRGVKWHLFTATWLADLSHQSLKTKLLQI